MGLPHYRRPDGTHRYHHHDLLGRLEEVEGPLGYRQQFFFDDQGRSVQRIKVDGSQQFTAYDDVGRLSELTLGSGAARAPLVLERGYSPLGQLDHLTLSGAGSASVSQQYQYDALGRMNFRTQQQGRATDIVAYTYDAEGRLIGSQHGEQAHRYSVDAAGNRLASQAQQALPDNRLTQLDDARYRYDGAGNLIERQQPDGERLTMGYDGANRLVHLTHASASGETRDATYRYDGLGRRISKTVRHPDGTTATTHYGWDGDRIVREETD
ncbi:RHS repeat protein, partial [Halomonas sp. BL6]